MKKKIKKYYNRTRYIRSQAQVIFSIKPPLFSFKLSFHIFTLSLSLMAARKLARDFFLSRHLLLPRQLVLPQQVFSLLFLVSIYSVSILSIPFTELVIIHLGFEASEWVSLSTWIRRL